MSGKTYDFTTATFFFFKALGRKPLGAVGIVVAQLIAYAAITAVALVAMAPFFAVVVEAARTDIEPSEAELIASLAPFILGMLGVGLLTLVLLVSLNAAWLRLMVRNEVKPVFALRFGADELRLLLYYICLIGFVLVAYLVIVALSAAVIALSAALVAAADGAFWGGLLAGLMGFAAFVVIAFLAIILALRFAAVPALIIHDRRFQLFSGFAASKGVVGWMFLSYLALIGVLLLASFVLVIIQQIVFVAGAMSAMAPLEALIESEPESVDQLLTVLSEVLSEPGVMAALILVLGVQLIYQVIADGLFMGVGAYAAVRHREDPLGDPENISAPSSSVGAAPSEG